MDKINSGLFNASNSNFDFQNFGIQPQLFVEVPKQTKVKGKINCSANNFIILFSLKQILHKYVVIFFLNYVC